MEEDQDPRRLWGGGRDTRRAGLSDDDATVVDGGFEVSDKNPVDSTSSYSTYFFLSFPSASSFFFPPNGFFFLLLEIKVICRRSTVFTNCPPTIIIKLTV